MEALVRFLEQYPELRTKRLLLRHYRYQDLEDLFEIFSSKKTTRYIYTYHESKKVTKRFLKYKIEHAYEGTMRDWVLENEEHKAIGILRIRFHLRKKEAEIAYVLNEKYWRKGYAYEACLKFLYYGFNQLKLNSICAQVSTNNIPSLNLLGRLRFSHEYTDRNFFLFHTTEHYRITKSQFKREVEVK